MKLIGLVVVVCAIFGGTTVLIGRADDSVRDFMEHDDFGCRSTTSEQSISGRGVVGEFPETADRFGAIRCEGDVTAGAIEVVEFDSAEDLIEALPRLPVSVRGKTCVIERRAYVYALIWKRIGAWRRFCEDANGLMAGVGDAG